MSGSNPEKRQATESGSDILIEPEVQKDPALEKVWRKMDLHILPVLAVFYLLSYLDRTNLGNARIAGLQTNLKMTDKQYSIALTVTFIPYIFAEIPSNLLLKAVGPNRLLPTLLTLWGIVTTTQGTIKSYQGLLVCRFFIGLLEGGVFPGLVLYSSYFYPRYRLNWIITGFFATASLSGAFSGILAYGIIRLDGHRGIHGWAWIFILEGLLTVVFGLCSYFLLPRTPEDCRFLTATERAYVVQRLRVTGATSYSESADTFSWKEVGQAFLLPQVQLVAVMFFVNGAQVFGLGYFTPSIVRSLGYTAARAQLFSVPPFAVAFFVSLISAYVSDHQRCRGAVVIFCGVVATAGFALYLGSHSSSMRYGSLFLSIPGSYCGTPVLAAWGANNTAPHIRRATAVAIGFIVGNMGGIMVTWLFGTLSPPPFYKKACVTMIILSAILVVFSMLNMTYLAWQNRKKAAIRATSSREEEKAGLGDRSAWFIYSL